MISGGSPQSQCVYIKTIIYLFPIMYNDWPFWYRKIGNLCVCFTNNFRKDRKKIINIVWDGPARFESRALRGIQHELRRTARLHSYSPIQNSMGCAQLPTICAFNRVSIVCIMHIIARRILNGDKQKWWNWNLIDDIMYNLLFCGMQWTIQTIKYYLLVYVIWVMFCFRLLITHDQI